MATIDEVRALKQKCFDWQFEGTDIFKHYSDEQLVKVFNGIGPDRFPAELRDALDELNPTLMPVALIHDMQYDFGGTEKDFYEDNAMFKRNGSRGACAVYPWYDPRRWWVRNQARVFSKICDKYGLEGYNLRKDPSNA